MLDIKFPPNPFTALFNSVQAAPVKIICAHQSSTPTRHLAVPLYTWLAIETLTPGAVLQTNV